MTRQVLQQSLPQGRRLATAKADDPLLGLACTFSSRDAPCSHSAIVLWGGASDRQR